MFDRYSTDANCFVTFKKNTRDNFMLILINWPLAAYVVLGNRHGELLTLYACG